MLARRNEKRRHFDGMDFLNSLQEQGSISEREGLQYNRNTLAYEYRIQAKARLKGLQLLTQIVSKNAGTSFPILTPPFKCHDQQSRYHQRWHYH